MVPRPEDPEMSCKELVELVTEYLHGTLPAPEHVRFETHLAVCPGCTEYLRQMRLTLLVTGRLEAESLPPHTRESLLDAFRDWKSGQ